MPSEQSETPTDVQTKREVQAREQFWTGLGILLLTYTFVGAIIYLTPSTPGKELPLMENIRFAIGLVVYGTVYWKIHGAALDLIGDSAEYSTETNRLQEWLA